MSLNNVYYYFSLSSFHRYTFSVWKEYCLILPHAKIGCLKWKTIPNFKDNTHQPLSLELHTCEVIIHLLPRYTCCWQKKTELCSASLCLKDAKAISLVTKLFETTARKFLAKTAGQLNISIFKEFFWYCIEAIIK